MARRDISASIARVIGVDAVRVLRLGEGWPSIFDVSTSTGMVPVAAHVTVASPHARREHEWRIQNPATRSPMTEPDGSLPIMVGLDNSGAAPVLVAIDGRSRVGRAARFSILFNHRISDDALRLGWSEYESANGQRVYALQPRLFPLLVEMLSAGVDVPQKQIAAAAAASGLLDDNDAQTAERARRTASAYVRDARFSRDVRAAYQHRCAMCGVRLGLVAGAHIYPVSAPHSPDQVWNGLALCHNHHSAFDAFKIWIEPNFAIRINPAYQGEATDNDSQRFLRDTKDALPLPHLAADRPRGDMLTRRYDYYPEQYAWAR